MAKKTTPKKRKSAATPKKPTIPQHDVAAKRNTTEQPSSVKDRIEGLLNELTDAEVNILMYEIENPTETRSIKKLARIAAPRLNREEAIRELAEMLIDYHLEQHPKLEQPLFDRQVQSAGILLRLLHLKVRRARADRAAPSRRPGSRPSPALPIQSLPGRIPRMTATLALRLAKKLSVVHPHDEKGSLRSPFFDDDQEGAVTHKMSCRRLAEVLDL